MASTLKNLLISSLILISNISYGYQFSAIEQDSLFRVANYTRSPEIKAECYMKISSKLSKTDFKQSMQYAMDAVKYAEKTDDKSLIGKTYKTLGIAIYNCYDYVSALETFLKAQELFIEESDIEEIFNIKILLGQLYARIHDHDAAMKSYQEALNIYDNYFSTNDTTIKISPSIYANIGLNYFSMDKIDYAEEYTHKAIELCVQKDSCDLEIYYLNLANILISKHEFEKAGKLLTDVEILCEKKHNKLSLGGLKLTHASLLLSQRKYSEASKYLKEVIDIANEINASALLCEALYMRSQINEKNGLYKEALMDFKKGEEISQNILSDEKIETLQKLKFASEAKFRENILIDKNKKASVRALTFAGIAMISLLFIIIIILLICIRMKNIRSEKSVLKNNLELKNKELISKTLFLTEKNEAIQNTINELTLLKNKIPEKKYKNNIEDCISNLSNAIGESSLKTFETYFNNVYESFYKKLENDYPELTPSDLRICAFLRLNLSSKEISVLLNQSVGSIDVSRSRIRKKLGLTDSTESLVKFLSKY